MSKGGGGGSIPDHYKITVGSDGSVIQIDSDLDNIHVKEIAPVTINSNVAVTEPIVTQSTSKTDSTLDLKVEPLNVDLKVEPLKVSADSAIDLKPVAIDSCQTLKLAPLPPIKLEQPYSQHFGLTFMGMELWGINVSGRFDTSLHSPPKLKHYSLQAPEPCGCSCESLDERQSAPLHSPSGLRVRIK